MSPLSKLCEGRGRVKMSLSFYLARAQTDRQTDRQTDTDTDTLTSGRSACVPSGRVMTISNDE